MRSLAGLTIGGLLGAAVAVALAVAAGPGNVPWFLVFVPAGMILGWRAGAAWNSESARHPEKG